MKKDEIKKYIELMYDQKSDLNSIEDLKERKIHAATRAKLNPTDLETIAIMELRNEKIRVEIINYLNKHNSNAFARLMADQQLLYNLRQRLIKPLEDEDDINKLMLISEKSEELEDRVSKNYEKIYKEPSLIEEAQKVIRMVTPEMRVREKKDMA